MPPSTDTRLDAILAKLEALEATLAEQAATLSNLETLAFNAQTA